MKKAAFIVLSVALLGVSECSTLANYATNAPIKVQFFHKTEDTPMNALKIGEEVRFWGGDAYEIRDPSLKSMKFYYHAMDLSGTDISAIKKSFDQVATQETAGLPKSSWKSVSIYPEQLIQEQQDFLQQKKLNDDRTVIQTTVMLYVDKDGFVTKEIKHKPIKKYLF